MLMLRSWSNYEIYGVCVMSYRVVGRFGCYDELVRGLDWKYVKTRSSNSRSESLGIDVFAARTHPTRRVL